MNWLVAVLTAAVLALFVWLIVRDVQQKDACLRQGLVPVSVNNRIACFEPEAVRRALAARGVDTKVKMP